MFSEFIGYTTRLTVRTQPSRMQHMLRRLGAWLGSRPQTGEQPDWARVPGRVWRRHSMLLVSLRELQAGMDHD